MPPKENGGARFSFATQPGWVSDKLLFVGNEKFSQYLVAGEQYALIGGGVAWNVARFEWQLDQFGVDRERLRYLIVTHVHHDHCGMVPYLLRRYPRLEALASPYGVHLFAKPDVAEVMDELNEKTLRAMGLPLEFEGVGLGFSPIETVRAVGDGEELRLGEDLVMRFLLTPGHSRCSLSVYLTGEQVLFPGDALPLRSADGRKLAVAANHDFNEYISSLEKMLPLQIRAIAYEHGGVMRGAQTDEEALHGLHAARAERVRIRRKFEELGDVELLIEEFADKYQELELFGQIDRARLAAILGRMIKSALGMV